MTHKEDIIQSGKGPTGKDSLSQWDQAGTEFTLPFCFTSHLMGQTAYVEQVIIQDQDLTLPASEATLWPTMNCERPV